MLGLRDVDGPLARARLHGFLDGVKPALVAALAQDPYPGGRHRVDRTAPDLD